MSFETVSCMPHYLDREIMDALLCTSTDVAMLGEAGLAVIVLFTGFYALLSWGQELTLPIVWTVLMMGLLLSYLPGPIDTWVVRGVTIVLAIAIYLAIRRIRSI